MQREGIDRDFFVVSIKDGNNFDGADTDKNTVGIMARDIRAIADKYSLMPVFVPMYKAHDRSITDALADAVGRGKVIRDLTAGELLGIMESAKFVIGTRLHMLVFAASAAVPMLGISYDPKIDAFLDYVGENGGTPDLRSLSDGEIFERAKELLRDSDKLRQRLNLRAEELRQLAKNDCDKLAELVGGE